MSSELIELKSKCPKNWDILPFCDAITDVTGGNPKVKKGNYKEDGPLAVIDQGQELIGGFVEDESQACNVDLPCIIFGDHTKIFKYIEQPFALGADGVKVLKPKADFDKRFLYHYLNTLKLPNNVGYSRHYKFLKEMFVVKPPLAEQKRIAAILDKADAMHRKRKQAIKFADDFLRATFLDMFGDPVTNPKGWEIVECMELCERITVGIVVRPASYYQESGVPALRSLNVRANRIETDNLVYFSNEDNETRLSKTRVWKGDLVLVRSGKPGMCAVVPKELNGVNAIDILIVTPKKSKVFSEFLSFYFNSSGGKQLVLGEQRGQIQKHLNVGSLKKAPIPLPPLNVQSKFFDSFQKVGNLQIKLNGMHREAINFFNSLNQRAFRGEL